MSWLTDWLTKEWERRAPTREDADRLVAEVLEYQRQLRLSREESVRFAMMLAKHGIDPVHGGPHEPHTISTFGT